MSTDDLNIYVCGVGGFGIGSVSSILSRAAMIKGIDSIGSETHGLAQRGGVVVSTLRLGRNLNGSPLIIKGNADIVFALEPLEALRAMPYLRSQGTVIYNTQRFQPLSVRLGQFHYPGIDEIEKELLRITNRVIPVEASAKAKELGLSESANVIMLGILTRQGLLPFDMEVMREAVRMATPEKYVKINLAALESD